MSRRKRSHHSSSPFHHHERSASGSPPKRQRTPDPPPSTGEDTLASILSTLKQIQTDMAKTNDHVSTIESRFEKPSGTFPQLHPTDDQISVLAYSDIELDYSDEEHLSQAIKPSQEAIKSSLEAIKPSLEAIKPSHETNVSQPTEEIQSNGATSNNNSTSSLYDPDCAQSSWVPQKELSTFLEKQFRRKPSHDQVREILDNYNIPSVDCLFTPTLDPSIINQVSPSLTKKYVLDRDKEMAAVQRALLNTTGPLCSLHDALSVGTQVPVEGLKSIVEKTLSTWFS